MLTKQLNFKYPTELVATEARPRGESRIFLIPRGGSAGGGESAVTGDSVGREISWDNFFDLFHAGDVLVLNDTRVLKARLILESASEGSASREVFFLRDLGERRWEVLTKGLRGRAGKEFELPGGVRARFVTPGKPAVIELLDVVDFLSYFDRHGHIPLPPYILALRESGSDEAEDVSRYQTVWASQMGSVAAPTASLHFDDSHLAKLRARGVDVQFVTLHVGAGTFLPLDVDKVEDFKIHSEWVSVSSSVADAVLRARAGGGRVWACGTTVMRALETAALRGKKSLVTQKSIARKNSSETSEVKNAPIIFPFQGETDLFIQPGFDFRVVDGLLTNFHQPESSLLLLAASFASSLPRKINVEGLPPSAHGGSSSLNAEEAVAKILRAYDVAIAQKFRLFSYGDLTVII